MKIDAQKYGGTSIRTSESRNITISSIKSIINKGKKVVSLVSSICINIEPYATSTFLIMTSNIEE